jgi:hypothetical protein
MNQSNRNQKNSWKIEQRTIARNGFPLSNDLLASLFEFVEASVDKEGCDHSRRFTEAWLVSNRVSRESLLSWLDSNGGFCDCEVVANAMQHWEENRG